MRAKEGLARVWPRQGPEAVARAGVLGEGAVHHAREPFVRPPQSAASPGQR